MECSTSWEFKMVLKLPGVKNIFVNSPEDGQVLSSQGSRQVPISQKDTTIDDSFKGDWSGATTYAVGEVVENDGGLYICKLESTNNEPPNATYWTLMSSDTDTDTHELDWKGEWSGATAYVISDWIENDGSAYKCVADNTDNIPPNLTYWELVSSDGEKHLLADTFTGESLDTDNWDETTVGSGSVVVTGGECTLDTGATLNSTAKIRTDVRSLRRASGKDIILEARMKVTKNGNDGWWQAGLEDSDGTDYAYYGHKTNGVSQTDWRTATENDGTTGSGDTEVVTNATYKTIKIVIKIDSVEFWLDDNLESTVSTADATPNDQEMYAYFFVKQGGGGGWNAIITLDWVQFTYVGAD